MTTDTTTTDTTTDTRTAKRNDVALGVFRLVVSFLFGFHGLMGLGFFGGVDGQGAAVPFGSWPGWYGSVVELAGAVLVLLGLWARPAAFVLSGVMAFAYFTVHQPVALLRSTTTASWRPCTAGRSCSSPPSGRARSRSGGRCAGEALHDHAAGSPPLTRESPAGVPEKELRKSSGTASISRGARSSPPQGPGCTGPMNRRGERRCVSW